MNSKHQSLNKVLNDTNSRLGNLTHKVTQITRINQHLQTILPEELRGHCFVVNIRDQLLILGTTSANWLTFLRFNAKEMLQQIKMARNHGELNAVNEVRCIIIPPNDKTNQHHHTMERPHLSLADAETIEASAKGIDDPALKEALLRLAKNVGKGQG